MSDKKENYLTPSDFFDAVLAAKRKGEVTNELGEMFMILADKIANHRYWIRYNHLRDDIVNENIYACMKAFEDFSPYKEKNREWKGEELEYHYLTCNNPHAWFTTCCFNNLKQYFRKYYNEMNVKNKMRVSMGLEPSDGYKDTIEQKEKDNSDVENFVEHPEEKDSGIEWE
tara:strand:+ start:75 stop:587 length:513 start_codon:yes stop_codon:yes gene_type:complete